MFAQARGGLDQSQGKREMIDARARRLKRKGGRELDYQMPTIDSFRFQPASQPRPSTVVSVSQLSKHLSYGIKCTSAAPEKVRIVE